MTERHGPLLVLATARRDAARSQITLGTLVIIIINRLAGATCKLLELRIVLHRLYVAIHSVD